MMSSSLYSAFVGTHWVATGPLEEVIRALYPRREEAGVFVFEHDSGIQRDFDWRGSVEDCLNRVLPAPPKGPGRPKLGVVSTEVTLLPRHWDWLARQPGKASATLRRLVERAIRDEAANPLQRRDALLKILWSLAGNEPEFEEAARSLTTGDVTHFRQLTKTWSGNLPQWVESWLTTGTGTS